MINLLQWAVIATYALYFIFILNWILLMYIRHIGKILIGICMLYLLQFAFAFEKETCNLGWSHIKHQHNESSYQHAWCSAHQGIEEYENEDKTRVDCLTKNYAVEFDFANKWAEAVGQAEHYAQMTGKRGLVVLILEKPDEEKIYFNRVKKLSEVYDFDVEYITDNVLNLINNKCPYLDCKCNKKHIDIN